MNRVITIILILCMCLGLFTGCNGNKDLTINEEVIRTEVLDEFLKLSEIPRESGNVKEISSYLRTWAEENGFKVIRDKSYNVIIEKDASKGYENSPTTILQCHMDMITVADVDVVFDPKNDKLKINNDGKTLKAEGTNLGSDSGIGIASALYILKNAEKHGPIRVIITSDKETTMRGAKSIDPKYLKGDFLINLDWEKDDSICISSAGTISFLMSRNITWIKPRNTLAFQLSINGLNGGNSGLNINNGGANAIKIIGETLAKAQGQGILFELAAFNGGTSKDTIPTEATAHIVLSDSDINKFKKIYNASLESFKDNYGSIEKNFTFTLTEAPIPDKVVSSDDNSSIISYIYGIVNGVQSLTSKKIVDSSSNIGIVSTASGDFISEVYIRSSSIEMAQEIINAHEAISTMCNLDYNYIDNTPIWSSKEDSTLVSTLSDIYLDLYDEKIKLKSVHYELECNWLSQKNPDLQIVSIGPRIKNTNHPDETLFLNTITKPAKIIITFLEQNL